MSGLTSVRLSVRSLLCSAPPTSPRPLSPRYDSYGDGWNGAAWTVVDEDGKRETGTLSSGYDGSAPLCAGTSCYMVSVDDGSYPYEMTWEVKSWDGTKVFASGAAEEIAEVCPPEPTIEPTAAPSPEPPTWADFTFGPLDMTMKLEEEGKGNLGAGFSIDYDKEQQIMMDLSAMTSFAKANPDKSIMSVETDLEIIDEEPIHMDVHMTMNKQTTCGRMAMDVEQTTADGFFLMNLTGCVEDLEDVIVVTQSDGSDKVEETMEEAMPWVSPLGLDLPGRDDFWDFTLDIMSNIMVRGMLALLCLRERRLLRWLPCAV